MSKDEEPKYSVLRSHDDIEIRQYGPKIVAETVVKGERDKACNDAFSILAEYIFGKNTLVTDIAMTTPIKQSQRSEKIAMTVPVIQQESGQDIAMTIPAMQTGDQTAWAIQFIMPSQYTLATLPKPKDSRITIKEVLGHTVAAIRFSGFAGDKKLRENEAKLLAYLNHQGIESKGKAIYAFYDPPFILPMFRRLASFSLSFLSPAK